MNTITSDIARSVSRCANTRLQMHETAVFYHLIADCIELTLSSATNGGCSSETIVGALTPATVIDEVIRYFTESGYSASIVTDKDGQRFVRLEWSDKAEEGLAE